MASWREIVHLVQQRAMGRCEYCRMHQSLQGATFHVEHVIPASLGGSAEVANLAWCCPSCNLYKSNNVEAVDLESGKTSVFFNPRLDVWDEHFGWEAYQIIARTPAGRATLNALRLNQPRRILIRRAEEMFDLFPP